MFPSQMTCGALGNMAALLSTLPLSLAGMINGGCMRSKKSWWFTGLAVCAVLALLLAQQRRSVAAADAITEITVEHTACHGFCPVYKLILRRDGTATCIGVQHTDRIGRYKAEIGPFDRLARAVEARGFFGLRDTYQRRVTDQAHVITSVVRGGRRKTVDNYADAGPQALWEIQAMTDGLAAGAHWRKVGPSTAYPSVR